MYACPEGLRKIWNDQTNLEYLGKTIPCGICLTSTSGWSWG